MNAVLAMVCLRNLQLYLLAYLCINVQTNAKDVCSVEMNDKSVYCSDHRFELVETFLHDNNQSFVHINLYRVFFPNNTITRDTLRNIGMSSVETLHIDHSELRNIEEGTFKSFYRLRSLSLIMNLFSVQAVTNVLCDLADHESKLVSLSLQGVFRYGMDNNFTDRAMDCLRRIDLNYINFSGNLITKHTYTKLLCALKNVSVLRLQSLFVWDIHTLPSDSFACIANSSVKTLDLSGNVLPDINNGWLVHLAKVKSLNLSNCQLSRKIEDPIIFLPLSDMEEIRFRNNNFNNPYMFTKMSSKIFPKLKLLDFSKNRFWWFKYFTTNLPSLQTLNISNNDCVVDNINSNFVVNLKSLTNLIINGNMYKRVHSTSFASETLENLEMMHSSVDLINLPNDVFQHAPKMRVLKLNSLNVHLLDQERTADVNEFFRTALKNLSNLVEVHLRNIGLSVLGDEMFMGCNSISYIDLSSNLINQLGYTLVNLASLRTVMLDRNLLSTINQTSFPAPLFIINPSHEISLSLRMNPWTCDCRVYWLRQILSGNTSNVKTYLVDMKEYVCETPSSLNGMKLSAYLDLYKNCDSVPLSSAYILLSCITLFISCILFIGSLVYRHKDFIYFIYVNQCSKYKEYRIVESADDYRYDALVCYHHMDSKWVSGPMQERLEKERGLKLNIHHRNWLGGVDIAENIHQNVEQSRKVVLIITDHFLSSPWCQYEMTVAHHHLISHDLDNVILIIKESLNMRYMTPRLAYLMSRRTYLEWKGEGDDIIWDRLANSIKDKSMGFIQQSV